MPNDRLQIEIVHDNQQSMSEKKPNPAPPAAAAAAPKEYSPGDGLRSLRTTGLFKAVNYELYVKPNAVIMGIGLVCLLGATGYIAYMRSKYDDMGYYSAVAPDGTEQFVKKKSKWDL